MRSARSATSPPGRRLDRHRLPGACATPRTCGPTPATGCMAAAAELDYAPSQLGRQLAERRHAANGIVFPDLSGPYYAEVVLGYEAVAAELGRSVLILSTHGRERRRGRWSRDLAGRCDGLVVLGRTVADEVVERARRRGTPLVLVARPAGRRASTPSTPRTAPARRALAEHLLGHGVRTHRLRRRPRRLARRRRALAGHRRRRSTRSGADVASSSHRRRRSTRTAGAARRRGGCLEPRRPARRLRLRQRRARARPDRPACARPASRSPATSWSPAGTT